MKAPGNNKLNQDIPEVNEAKLRKLMEKAESPSQEVYNSALDPEAARSFKTTTMPFNEYEYNILMAAVEKSGCKTVKGFMREAYMEKARRILEGIPCE